MGHIREHRSHKLEESPMAHHLVVGQGPVGTALAAHLVERGHDVVVVSRSGPRDSGDPSAAPSGGLATEHPTTGRAPGVQHVAADVARAGTLPALARGAAVVYNCVNPPYHRWPELWPPLHAEFLAAAESSGAVLVTTSNLYGHGRGSGTMREDTPLASTETKGRVRAAMWLEARRRHEAGTLRATEVRAADYFGPGAGSTAHYGARLLGPLLAGRPLRPVGDPDVPHAIAYLPDLVRALAAAGTTAAAWGRPWLAPHLPAETFRQVAHRFAAAAGAPEPRISPVPGFALAAAGLVSGMMREVRRVTYQFTEPFEVDSRVSESVLGVTATPWQAAVGATLAWWREHEGVRTPAA